MRSASSFHTYILSGMKKTYEKYNELSNSTDKISHGLNHNDLHVKLKQLLAQA